MTVSACHIPDRPVWWPSARADTAATTASGASLPVLKVAKPWRPGMRQLGIDVYWVANTTDPAAVVSAKARRIINYAVGLHANSISLSFPFYTDGITSNTLFAQKDDAEPRGHRDVPVRGRQEPHPRDAAADPQRGQPVQAARLARRDQAGHRAAWFASYTKLLLPYAKVASAGHAATFVVGTELNSLETDSHWPALIRSVRRVLPGELAYDENTGSFAAHDESSAASDLRRRRVAARHASGQHLPWRS